MRKLLLFFLLICVSFCAAMADPLPQKNEAGNKLILNVRQALRRISPFKVSFSQQVYTDHQMDLQESGDIYFINDKKLKWVYRDPDYKVFLLEGDNYRFYDEDSEQLRIGKVEEKQKQWIWQLLFSDEILAHTTSDSDGKSIHIKKTKENIDVTVKIDSHYLPVEIVQVDSSEIRMVYLFSDYTHKINVTDEMFELKVPEDVEIIRDKNY